MLIADKPKVANKDYVQTPECNIDIEGPQLHLQPTLYRDAHQKALTRHLIPVSQINHAVRCTRVQLPLAVELTLTKYLMV